MWVNILGTVKVLLKKIKILTRSIFTCRKWIYVKSVIKMWVYFQNFLYKYYVYCVHKKKLKLKDNAIIGHVFGNRNVLNFCKMARTLDINIILTPFSYKYWFRNIFHFPKLTFNYLSILHVSVLDIYFQDMRRINVIFFCTLNSKSEFP